MKQIILVGATDQTAQVVLRTSTGTRATGKVAADLTLSYSRVENDNDVVIADQALSDLALLTTTHADGGLKEVHATKHPGLYRLDLPDAMFAAGARSTVATLVGTGLDPCDVEFQLDEHYYSVRPFFQDANAGTPTDKYTIVCEEDGVKIEADVTTVQMRVLSRTAGTEIFTWTTMNEAGSSHIFYLDKTTDLMVAGTGGVPEYRFTYKGAVRTWCPGATGRDSASA